MKDTILIYNPKDLVSILKFTSCPECMGDTESIAKPEDTNAGYRVKIQCCNCKKTFWKIVDRMDVVDKVKVTIREITKDKNGGK